MDKAVDASQTDSRKVINKIIVLITCPLRNFIDLDLKVDLKK